MKGSLQSMQQRMRYFPASKPRSIDAETGLQYFDRKKGVTRIIGIAVIVFLIANVVIFALLTSFHSGDKDNSVVTKSNATVDVLLSSESSSSSESTSATIINPLKKKGLYQDSPDVLELWSPSEVDTLLTQDKHPTVVVFYASWCPHCRHFAPTYDAYSRKVQSIANYLHQQFELEHLSELSKDQGRPFRISFAAIDCPQVNAACDKYKIEAYPTIVAFNFHDNKTTSTDSAAQKYVGSLSEIDKLLKRTLFQHGELDDPKLAQASVATATVTQLLQAKKSHIMPAILRIEDAWMSFVYFLTYELPSEGMSRLQVQTLRRMSALFAQFLTDAQQRVLKQNHSKLTSSFALQAEKYLPKWQERLQFLQECEKVFHKYAHHQDNFPANKIHDVLKQYRMPTDQQFVWHGCGIPINTNSYSTSRSSMASSPTSTPSFKSIFQSFTNSNSKDVDSKSSEDVAGYSCGLWMMFHIFSLSGHKTSLPLPLLTTTNNQLETQQPTFFQATEVKLVIHDFVERFFRCFSCRSHFLHSYDSCLFRHCQLPVPVSVTEDTSSRYTAAPIITSTTDKSVPAPPPNGEEDYHRLQFWLFQLHNLVANRIVLEKENLFLQQNLTRAEVMQVLQAKMWPSRSECPTCYQHNNNADNSHLAYLLETYRQKVMRKRDFQQRKVNTSVILQSSQSNESQNNNGSSNNHDNEISISNSNNAYLRGHRNGADASMFLRFETEADVEWMLQYVIDHLFVREEVLKFLQHAYVGP